MQTIVSEYGTEDSGLLEKKLKEMRILENVDLPAAFADLLVKPEESVIPSDELENPEEEIELISEEHESDKEGTQDKEELLEEVPKPPKLVRMANLCVVSAHAVNGVAEIHSEIVKDEVFNDFHKVKCLLNFLTFR